MFATSGKDLLWLLVNRYYMLLFVHSNYHSRDYIKASNVAIMLSSCMSVYSWRSSYSNDGDTEF